MQVIKHTHQYVRVKGMVRDGKPFLYRCGHPECSHREEKKFLEGKFSLCNKCGGEFKLTNEDLKRARPVCKNCSNTNEAKTYRKVKEGITNVMEDLFQ